MEVKKYDLSGLEGKELELAQNHNALVDEVKSLDTKSVEYAEYKGKFEALQADILDIKANANQNKVEVKSVQDQIVEGLQKAGINNIPELKSAIASGKNISFEVKSVATTDYTGSLARTNIDSMVQFAPTRPLAFVGKLRQVSEATGKDTFAYVEGTYTSNANYVGEGAGNANGDTAVAVEKTMPYAKFHAWQTVTEETFEGLPDFANRLVEQMKIAVDVKLDSEIYVGDGLAPAGKQHIKGLKDVYATEFDTTPYTAKIAKANIANVIKAMAQTINTADGAYVATDLVMNPIDYFVMSEMKDTTGQPIMKTDVFGNSIIAGLRVSQNKVITENTCLVYDNNVVELRTKRSWKFNAGKIFANDNFNDTQSAQLIGRYQVLVRDLDKVAVLKCSDIDAAIADIDKP
jgi:HK97 family phage major capsid protein